MPRLYKMSVDTSEKEKIVGGLITAEQAGWIAGGMVLAIIIFLILRKVIPQGLALALGVIPGLTLGCMFAFYKKNDIPIFRYFMLKNKYKKKQKILLNTVTYGKVFDSEPSKGEVPASDRRRKKAGKKAK